MNSRSNNQNDNFDASSDNVNQHFLLVAQKINTVDEVLLLTYHLFIPLLTPMYSQYP